MGATKKEVAEQLGVAKQTVVNYIVRLGLEEHVTRMGKTDVLDDFAVSAIADAIGKNVPPVTSKDETDKASDAITSSMLARIEDLKERNVALSEMLKERDREISELRAQVAAANERNAILAERVAGIAERQQVLAATPWWRRARMAMKLLGPGSD